MKALANVQFRSVTDDEARCIGCDARPVAYDIDSGAVHIYFCERCFKALPRAISATIEYWRKWHERWARKVKRVRKVLQRKR